MNVGKYLETDKGQKELHDALAKWHDWFPEQIRTIKIGESTTVYDLDPMDKFVIWLCNEDEFEESTGILKDIVEYGASAMGPIHIFESQWQEYANEEVENYIDDNYSGNFLTGLVEALGDKAVSFSSMEEWIGYLAIEIAAQRVYDSLGLDNI